MIKINNLTIKNFLSVGNSTQAINFSSNDLTLVLGENLDLSSNGSRNGSGKCVCVDTIVKVRNKRTGEIYEITIGDLYEQQRKVDKGDAVKD